MTHQVDAKRMLDERGYTGPTVHGVNPAHLLEKAVRDRITESYYWKEQCFALNAASLCDRAVSLSSIGGTYGQQKPTPFLCLALKLLQLLPERAIVLECLRQPYFKYLTVLAAFHVRLTFAPIEVYTVLEPLLGDWRRLRRRTREGGWRLTFVDEFVDELLTKERVCGTSLRKLPARTLLEDLGQLEERISPLADELDDLDAESGRDEDDRDGEDDDGQENNRERRENGERNEHEEREEDGDRNTARDAERRTRQMDHDMEGTRPRSHSSSSEERARSEDSESEERHRHAPRRRKDRNDPERPIQVDDDESGPNGQERNRSGSRRRSRNNSE